MQPQRNPPPAEEAAEPLIQDMTPGKKKQQALKKGFFNNAKESLYPPEGSKEGVVPENAGDPMGYLPKGLRKSCRIIDTNAPEYQETERKKKAAEEHNSMAKEFNDMMVNDMSKFTNASSQWGQDDMPDGAEPEPTQKYEVDYSRFDKIEDVTEKVVVEERDWYYDEKGVRRTISASKSNNAPGAPSAAGAGPAMKKGFLDSAKTPLYPKGSEQRAPPTDAEFMKNQMKGMENDKELMEALGMSLGNDHEARTPQAQKPSVVAKVPELKTPQFTLERDDNEGLLQVVVDVPGLESMKGVDLDVTDTLASFVFPGGVRLRPLKVELPAAVLPSGVKAKFSKKTSQITVKLPLALKVAKAG